MELTVIPLEGLANRMFAIAAGFYLAEKTNRELTVIWQKNKGLNADYQDIFQYNPSEFRLKSVSPLIYNLYYDIPRKKNFYLPKFFHLLDSNKWIYHISAQTAFLDDDFFFESASKLKKNLIVSSCYPFYEPNPEIYKSLFKPTETVKNRMKEIYEGRQIDLSIQIRRTDHKLSKEKSPVSLFEGAVITELSSKPDALIFLATDDREVKHYFKERFPNNIIYNHKDARRDCRDGIIDAVAEMFIMAESKKIYGSYSSTFSLMAALLGNVPLVVLQKQ